MLKVCSDRDRKIENFKFGHLYLNRTLSVILLILKQHAECVAYYSWPGLPQVPCCWHPSVLGDSGVCNRDHSLWLGSSACCGCSARSWNSRLCCSYCRCSLYLVLWLLCNPLVSVLSPIFPLVLSPCLARLNACLDSKPPAELRSAATTSQPSGWHQSIGLVYGRSWVQILTGDSHFSFSHACNVQLNLT